MGRVTREKLDKYLGKEVRIHFKDGQVVYGVLGFTPEFSSKYGYRKPNYYTIGDLSFKASHIRSVMAKGLASDYDNKRLRL
jgi:hypothetical protein